MNLKPKWIAEVDEAKVFVMRLWSWRIKKLRIKKFQ